VQTPATRNYAPSKLCRTNLLLDLAETFVVAVAAGGWVELEFLIVTRIAVTPFLYKT